MNVLQVENFLFPARIIQEPKHFFDLHQINSKQCLHF